MRKSFEIFEEINSKIDKKRGIDGLTDAVIGSIMSERKVEIYKIIRDKWQYLLEEPARKLIHDIAKEACIQVLELASENAKVIKNEHTSQILSNLIDKQSILNTINQVE